MRKGLGSSLAVLAIVLAGCNHDSLSSTCVSPTQNADKAWDPGAVGCPCDEDASVVCGSGGGFECVQGSWMAFYDGPCE